ncbi:MAG: Asp23/Gls24 family envelope stress response protein [Clostridia bacterium]|nr:Asp23/Gls24 family envelope stress response protein [Clostridia bacterium]
MMFYETRFGKIEVSDQYLEKLIGNAAVSCFGVAGMVPSNRKQRIMGLLSKDKEYVQKGISLRTHNDTIFAELHIIVTYGTNMNAVAKSIINKVKYTVSEAVDIPAENVTVVVKIDGIITADGR